MQVNNAETIKVQRKQAVFKVPEIRVGKQQSVKCLPCQHEDPSSIFKTHVKMPGVMTHTCNPSIGEAETDGFGGPLSD